MANPTEPGWYQDPYGSDDERWYDGTQWSGTRRDYETAPAPDAASSPPETSSRGASLVSRLDRTSVVVGVVVALVLAAGVYGVRSFTSSSANAPTSAASGVTATGKFCPDFQRAGTSTPLGSNTQINAGTSRASLIAELGAFHKSAVAWMNIGAQLASEAPTPGVRDGLVATASLMHAIDGPATSVLTALGKLPANASSARLSAATGPLMGAMFMGALSVGAAGGKAIKNLPAALDAACGTGFAARLGLHTQP